MNRLLTEVGPGTGCGNLLRRYWQPLCPAADLTPDRPVRRVRLLGESVVVFRDARGRCGCLAERCAHRGCSLYYGFVEDEGLRCPYHGWKYDAAGRCLEQPFEPAGSRYRDQVRQTAYPVQELAGLLFAYMGPEPAPLLPRWDVVVREDGERRIEVHPTLRCSWLQAMENTVDTVHRFFLHGHMMRRQGLAGGEYYYRSLQRYEYDLCEWGVTKVCVYGGERPEVEVMPPLIFPNILRITQGPWECLHWRVPIDDVSTRIIWMGFLPEGNGGRRGDRAQPPVVYLPDMLTAEGEHDLRTFYSQDKMAWETQGEVFDRTREHLGASDRGVVLYRQLLARQIAVVGDGGEPMALVRDPAQNVRIDFEHTLPVVPG